MNIIINSLYLLALISLIGCHNAEDEKIINKNNLQMSLHLSDINELEVKIDSFHNCVIIRQVDNKNKIEKVSKYFFHGSHIVYHLDRESNGTIDFYEFDSRGKLIYYAYMNSPSSKYKNTARFIYNCRIRPSVTGELLVDFDNNLKECKMTFFLPNIHFANYRAIVNEKNNNIIKTTVFNTNDNITDNIIRYNYKNLDSKISLKIECSNLLMNDTVIMEDFKILAKDMKQARPE